MSSGTLCLDTLSCPIHDIYLSIERIYDAFNAWPTRGATGAHPQGIFGTVRRGGIRTGIVDSGTLHAGACPSTGRDPTRNALLQAKPKSAHT